MSHLSTGDPRWCETAAQYIIEGKVVALAYEHLFGLAADAFNIDAVARSAAIKDRPRYAAGDKPISVILPHIDALEKVCTTVGPLAKQLAAAYWPGPLTLLLPAKDGLPAPLVGQNGLIGVRVPGPCPAMALAQHTGKILTATSANKRGAAEPLTAGGLDDLELVDLIVAGTVDGPPGSTVVDVSGASLRVLRQGRIVL